MMRKNLIQVLFAVVLAAGTAAAACAGEGVSINTSLDLYSRYIWRGLELGDAPSIQPALSLSWGGFELGTWGSYSVSSNGFAVDETDFWMSYTHSFKGGVSITAIANDYYFPEAGTGFFNFHGSGAPDPGAHTLEMGLSFTGPESFPVTLSAYVNVHNDAGSNAYFQVDYPVTVKDTELNLFCGFAGGSRDNPDYYGTDRLAVINLGVTALREIKVSESFSPSLKVSLILNPKIETAFLIVGIGL
jgi:uncharacterized protein (TIGR02001 family)